jgi:hypothetical protein
MTEPSVSVPPASQDGVQPDPPAEDAGPLITPPERILGVLGLCFALVIGVLALDLLTGWPSAVLASLGGSGDADA